MKVESSVPDWTSDPADVSSDVAAFFLLLFLVLMIAASPDRSYSTGPDDLEFANRLLISGPALLLLLLSSALLLPFFPLPRGWFVACGAGARTCPAFFLLLFLVLMIAASPDRSYSTGPDDLEFANRLLISGPALLLLLLSSALLLPFFRFLEDGSLLAALALAPAPKLTPSSWIKSAHALDVLGDANGKPPAELLVEPLDGVDGVSPLPVLSFSPRIPRPSHVISLEPRLRAERLPLDLELMPDSLR
mmetsp:Transcript_30068/g.73038  ORF Transcript_30068/g.73038 Transcript_30068/m.73038 type:complete len:248 (+) Transcript_30068:1426-2169(+)